MENTALVRFKKQIKINPSTGCWDWTSYLHRGGYGRIKIKGKYIGANRWSYEHFKGPIRKGLCVCHSCDNPSCVNPEHLWLGTQKENMQDMSLKKRRSHICGEKCGNAKLTEVEVKDILKSTRTFTQLARAHNVTYQTIKAIKLRKTWKHVTI